MKKLIAILACSSCGIVSGSIPVTASSTLSQEDSIRLQHCIELDNEHLVWTVVSTIGSSIATGSATLVPITNEYVSDHSDRWVIGLSISGVIGAGFSVLGITLTSDVDHDWAKYHCDDFL